MLREVIIAPNAGFCFGVKRAVELAEQAAASGRECYTLGQLIHNRSVTTRLEEMGVRPAGKADDIPAGSVAIIRSHGEGRGVFEALKEKNIAVVDATCPYVKKIHEIAAEAENDNRILVIIGEENHPEITAIRGWSGRSVVFSDAKELQMWLDEEEENRFLPLTVVSQTTGTRKNWEESVENLKKQCTNYKIFDTICNATFIRQNEAEALSDSCGAMVVIGDVSSANSHRLYEICRKKCPNTVFVQDAGAFEPSSVGSARVVGVTAGASTPLWIIKEVVNKMSDEIRSEDLTQEAAEASSPEEITEAAEAQDVPEAEIQVAVPEVIEPEAAEPEVTESEVTGQQDTEEEEESFESMLEKSIVTLSTGDKVTGMVVAISATEVTVDLGAKQAGYISLSELSDDPGAKAEEIAPVGSEIEAIIIRVNDVDGYIMLSKKRLDAAKSWDILEQSREDKETLEGRIVDENKGGVVALVKGLRVFIPASQTGLGRGSAMTELVGKTVNLRITEVNRARRRVVGSIRVVESETRRARSEQIWAEIEEGKGYPGTVKSLTSYGAFVDIGGIDGMVHVSELSWSRIKHPSEVINVGDTVEVYVISFDRDNRKISLGYKDKSENPWVKFTNAYQVDSIAEVKIVKLMPFGAFAEIVPGVDGLIHISQIADRRIGTPGEILSEGEVVKVKITEIDHEKQKVSLSIRALLTAPYERGDGEEQYFTDELADEHDEPAYDESTEDMQELY